MHHLSNEAAGWLSGLVMFGGAAGLPVRRLGRGLGLREPGPAHAGPQRVSASGFALAAVSMLIGSRGIPPCRRATATPGMLRHTPHAAATWGAGISAAGTFALFAVINSIGQFGAAGAQALFGCIPRSEWGHAFGVCGLLLVVGAFCWSQVDGRKTLGDAA